MTIVAQVIWGVALALGALVSWNPSANATLLQLDLADIVGGGDGTGTGNAQGIDPRDGSVQVNQFIGRLPNAIANNFSLASNPFVDGVFVPDGGPNGQNQVPISSTGIFTTGIADANDPAGITWDYIWNGLHSEVSTNNRFSSVLGMHANKGITFDLESIENANPGFSSSVFSVGLSIGMDARVPSVAGPASLYVIVDGAILESTVLDTPDDMISVNVNLLGSDRFLTLLTASNGDIRFDNTLFLDPLLTLESIPEPKGLVVLIAGLLSVIVLGRQQRRVSSET